MVAVLSVLAVSARAQDPIPAAEIIALREAMEQGAANGRSAVAGRRANKNTARKGLALVEANPDAPNRFRVLGIVFQCQKRLLALDNSEKNRDAVFDTCEKLAEAPDEYARERLEADLLLSEKELSERDATLEVRAEALAALVERYRGTIAEARSLLMAALIVQKLDSRELESQILYALDERFCDDHEVIEFRRKFLKISRLDLVFSGTFRKIDGTALVFPSDTMGHMSLVVFWSKNKPGLEKYLAMMQEGLARTPAPVKVFSFNLDNLPDGGESVLKEHGLAWTIMKLPGGRRHQAYRSYAQGDPVAVLVNEYGLAVTRPEIVHGRTSSLESSRISEDRYTTQLQSVFIGDFLVADQRPATSDQHRVPHWKAIQSCFVPPPFRYRLTREEALANYTRAATLCTDLLKRGASSADLWKVRNARIIALLGMWNLACEPAHLEEAVAEARKALAMNGAGGRPTPNPSQEGNQRGIARTREEATSTQIPSWEGQGWVGSSPEAQVVPRFCLARQALRAGGEQPESVVASFLEECGGNKAPVAALAAASVLALDARSRELHDAYRARFLALYGDDPAFYAFSSFLRDRHLQYRLLKANHTLRERRARGYIVGHGYPWPTNCLPNIELKNLDGSTLSMPKDTNGKMTYLMFVEPPAGGGTNNWYIKRDSHGRVRGASGVHTVMGYADHLTKTHVNGDINFVAAFLTDDTDHVKHLVQTNGWECQPVMVPGGLHNPMVRRLGVLSADRFPNVFLLRRDGTIAWRGSGLRYQNEFGYPFAVHLAMKVHVEVCEMEHGYKALERGDYEEAVRVFAGPFPEERPQRYGWRSPRYHGKALAHVGLREWDAALDAIDKAIDAHKLRHFHGFGRRSKSLADWRKDAARVTMKQPCDVITDLWAVKALILEKLGRKEDASTFRKRSEEPAQEEYPHVYKLFHERLHRLREEILH